MNEMQRSVKEFHEKYDAIPLPNEPTMPTHEIRLLRTRLIIEETAEFVEAASRGDMVEMVDALCDLLYVTFGTALFLGIDVEPVFQEVQRSNMTKDGGGQDCAGKICKGPSFEPPNVLGCLQDQGWWEDTGGKHV